MLIKEFSELSGLPVNTLRYYERLGLMPPPARDGADNRVYGPADLSRARQLNLLRLSGMPLAQMRDYLDGAMDARGLHDLLASHRAVLRSKIAEIQACLERIDEEMSRLGGGASDRAHKHRGAQTPAKRTPPPPQD